MNCLFCNKKLNHSEQLLIKELEWFIEELNLYNYHIQCILILILKKYNENKFVFKRILWNAQSIAINSKFNIDKNFYNTKQQFINNRKILIPIVNKILDNYEDELKILINAEKTYFLFLLNNQLSTKDKVNFNNKVNESKIIINNYRNIISDKILN